MLKRLFQIAAFIAVCIAVTACSREPAQQRNLSFNESIQPILSANCYGCHGPDTSSRRAGLRLDRAEAAFAPHENFGPAIVPGKPDQSPLVHRIEAKNAKERMPPPEAHKTLKPEQIKLLRQWVEEGAHYEPHWAFIAPQRSVVPRESVDEGKREWVRNPIDSFILERLKKEKLSPSVEADKRSLIRRVTYDLTGLPPTVEEVDEFVADSADDAYEKLVDRLLASSRYGEHRAHYWLDYVRYADTHGLHLDNYRAIWPYRDYVINAFNANKRFDEFVREQIAGDLLAKQSLDALIATGYIRANVTTDENGSIPEEVSVNLTRDRVETFGVTFVGLTTGCAVCHDHKFDPTTQKDVYQLAAFLNNTVDGPMDFNTPDPPPVIRLPDDKDRATYEKLLRDRGDLVAHLEKRRSEMPEMLKAQLLEGEKPKSVSPERLDLRLRFDEGSGDVIHNSAPGAAIKEFRVDSAPVIWGETSWLWPDARFDTNTRLPLGKVGDIEVTDAFSVGGWIMLRPTDRATDRSTDIDGAIFARLGNRQQSNGRGWEVAYRQYSAPRSFDNGNPQGRIFVNLVGDPTITRRRNEASPRIALYQKSTGLMGHAVQVRIRDEIPTAQWLHIFVTYDGSGKGGGVRIYIDGKAVATEVLNDSLRPKDSIRTDADTHLGRRDYDGYTLREARYQDVRFYRRALDAGEVARLPYEDVASSIVARTSDPARWTPEEARVVLDEYLLNGDEQGRQIRSRIVTVQSEIDRLAPPPERPITRDYSTSPFIVSPKRSAADVLKNLMSQRPSSLIAQEKPTPPFANILTRGNYAARGERVGPGTPHFLPPLPSNVTPNRLALANWLVTPENPLFARVAVNRMWQEVFGIGLVESAGDFGVMGDRPSHPKLLDWLAVEFRESGWDVKHIYRLLLLSAAYRQSAYVTPELTEVDPKNRLLARGPRFRMDAESVRDSALAVSGLLVEKLGGPPVMPYQPAGVWREVAIPTSNTRDYIDGHGDALYRRSIYSFWKRSSPLPSMELFDAVSRETACPRRPRSNTPLQALVLLNDPQFVEAARMLAQKVLNENSNSEARLNALAKITLSRNLDQKEEEVLERSHQQMVKRFSSQPQAAKELLSVGSTRLAGDVDVCELAAWTMTASVFLNLDEFLTK